MTEARYLEPGWFTRNVFNKLMERLATWGVSLRGSRQLAVRGRVSGEWKTVPVNPLDFDGERYLVAPRGETQWVRNIRVAGGGELRLGRRTEEIAVAELTDDVKPAILREYVRRWKAEVGQFFPGIDGNSSDDDLAAIAPGFPVFRIAPFAGAA
ncbi:MAG: nitroreductase/quinone reductase family protein [Acidimicrobiales bacterium]